MWRLTAKRAYHKAGRIVTADGEVCVGYPIQVSVWATLPPIANESQRTLCVWGEGGERGWIKRVGECAHACIWYKNQYYNISWNSNVRSCVWGLRWSSSYLTVKFSFTRVEAVLHFLTVMNTSCTGIRKFAPKASVLDIARLARPTEETTLWMCEGGGERGVERRRRGWSSARRLSEREDQLTSVLVQFLNSWHPPFGTSAHSSMSMHTCK